MPTDKSKIDFKRFSGFYKKSSLDRLKIVQELIPSLTDEDIQTLLTKTGSLELSVINHMIENAVGSISVPFGLGVNFLINGEVKIIPMAVEEPSVIAAVCNSAKLTLVTGGFTASSTDQIMIGQIQILDITNTELATKTILEHKDEILMIANRIGGTIIEKGGGAIDIRTKILETDIGSMLICEILIDCLDAMGANKINAMLELVAPYLEEITKGRVLLRILSNLSDLRMAKANCVILKESLGGEQVVDDIVAASIFAEVDPYRAATHNKGIMNGVSSVILATSNDTRAIEAGAHAYAARKGKYTSLTSWSKNENGDLVGLIELPIAVGIVGGSTKTNPVAQIALKILQVKSAAELALIAASVGLAQNLAALRALVTAGIIKGHMKLHSKNIAIAVGAKDEQISLIAEKMISENNIKFSRALELLNELTKNSK